MAARPRTDTGCLRRTDPDFRRARAYIVLGVSNALLSWGHRVFSGPWVAGKAVNVGVPVDTSASTTMLATYRAGPGGFGSTKTT